MSTDTSTKDNYETYCNGGKFPPPSLPTSRGMLPLCRCLPMKPMILYIATTLENQGRRFWRVAIGRKNTKPTMSGFGMMNLVQLPDQWLSAIQLFQTQRKQTLHHDKC
ncbi:hypothetical protein MtrunA17_Chr8g0344011 [Medicago truncatula]|uniref:Uncharacterized protein n=1 Tax=Medicago truncatula TaxID=3880 RepID=A0A396GL18_MEDTR|nr:hypothetical protein MtrunA17_Chr8g0344011 [Medicago truncatula]